MDVSMMLFIHENYVNNAFAKSISCQNPSIHTNPRCGKKVGEGGSDQAS